jgi:hypothetical protein
VDMYLSEFGPSRPRTSTVMPNAGFSSMRLRSLRSSASASWISSVVRSVQKALAVPSFFLDTKLSTVHDAKGSVGVMIEATTLLVAYSSRRRKEFHRLTSWRRSSLCLDRSHRILCEMNLSSPRPSPKAEESRWQACTYVPSE